MKPSLESIAEGRPYRRGAYEFVMQALEFSMNRLDLPRHISGGELLEGIRLHALEEFGPIARHVLAHWGIHETRDFGRAPEPGGWDPTREGSVWILRGLSPSVLTFPPRVPSVAPPWGTYGRATA